MNANITKNFVILSFNPVFVGSIYKSEILNQVQDDRYHNIRQLCHAVPQLRDQDDIFCLIISQGMNFSEASNYIILKYMIIAFNTKKLGLNRLIFKENCIIINCVSLRGVKTTKQSHFLQVNKEIASPAAATKSGSRLRGMAGSQCHAT